MLRRIFNLFTARNKEFIRDRSALAWNLLFPFLIIMGFSLMFTRENQAQFKIGVVSGSSTESTYAESSQSFSDYKQFPKKYERFFKTKYIEFINAGTENEAMQNLGRHRLDLVINPLNGNYWVSDSSPKGYIAERLLFSALSDQDTDLIRSHVTGIEVPYVEWLFPGILGMNMMFSALFGVGYVVVRYRKNGVLKRMSVTPVRPLEFLSAQVLSRIFLLLITTAIVYIGCSLIFGFTCRGSYLNLVLVFFLGGFSMISLGLLVSARSSSEEFAGGILNLITWPMMFLSEVWFSLEGAHPLVRKLSYFFPLTHLVEGARNIMNHGAGMNEIAGNILSLVIMSTLFLTLGSLLFRWQRS